MTPVYPKAAWKQGGSGRFDTHSAPLQPLTRYARRQKNRVSVIGTQSVHNSTTPFLSGPIPNGVTGSTGILLERSISGYPAHEWRGAGGARWSDAAPARA